MPDYSGLQMVKVCQVGEETIGECSVLEYKIELLGIGMASENWTGIEKLFCCFCQHSSFGSTLDFGSRCCVF